MAAVVVAESAQADLYALIVTHGLPITTRDRVRAALSSLAAFPLIGPGLDGRWKGFRFILGPWAWMLLVYLYDEALDQVSVVAIHDSRSALAPTAERKARSFLASSTTLAGSPPRGSAR